VACQELAYKSDSILELRDLKDEAGLAVTTATVTAQLHDEDGAAIGSAIPIAHVSSGLYRGVIPDALWSGDPPALAPGKMVRIVVVADAGADKHLERVLRAVIGSA